MSSYRVIGGWIALAVFAVGVAILGRIGSNVRWFQAAYAIGFAGYAALLWSLRNDAALLNRGSWRWWIVGCIAIRALLISTSPSDDIYRYVWEGRVQLAGHNPFVHAPLDPTLERLRDDDWKSINHPDYPAIYGPVAQAQFLVVAAVSTSIHLMKAVLVGWDVLAVIMLGVCLHRLDRPPHLAIAYALCPLVLTAFAVEGHIDSLMLFFVSVTVWAILANRPSVAGVSVGLAMAVKVVPVVLLPWLIVRRPRAALIAVAVCAACYVPYAGAGMSLLTSLARFGTENTFFTPTALLNALAGVTDPEVLRLESCVAVIALGATLLVLARRIEPFRSYAVSATSALLILAPTVHFWYLSWVLIFAPLTRCAPWIVASLPMVLYYEATHRQELTGAWSMPPASAIVFWSVLAIAWLHQARRKRFPTST